MKKLTTILIAAVAVLLTLTGCKTSDLTVPDSSPSSPRVSSAAAAPSHSESPSVSRPVPGSPANATNQELIARQALVELASLPVKGRAPKTGYARSEFGDAWSDDVPVTYGHNGCDTRNDVLKRDMTAIKYKPRTTCAIASGTLNDPYTGKTIHFVQGRKTSLAVQIDHVVALADAWQKGAQQLSPQERIALANDPRNLMAVDGPTNGAKGAGDAATWLPPNKAYRCTYVAKQVSVKKIYRLWITAAEKKAITGLLTGCAQ